MPRLPTTLIRTSLRAPLITNIKTTSAASATRALSTTTSLRAATSPSHSDHSGTDGGHASAAHDAHGHGHESHYDAPGGWLWGIPPGEKAKREGWEIPFYGLYCAPLVIAVGVYAMKEDTSIQTWALEEARRRLEKEGILEDKE